MIWLLLWLYFWGFALTGLTCFVSAKAERCPELAGWQNFIIGVFWPVFWPGIFIAAFSAGVWDSIKRRS